MADPDFSALETEEELEAASNDLEGRRLTAHVAHRAEGSAIAKRRRELARAKVIAAMSPQERAEMAEALAAAAEAEG